MHKYGKKKNLNFYNSYDESINVEIAFLDYSNYLFDNFYLLLVVDILHICFIGLYFCLLNTSELEIDAMFNIMNLVANFLDKTPPIRYQLIDSLPLDVIVSINSLLHEFVVDYMYVQQVNTHLMISFLILLYVGDGQYSLQLIEVI